MTINCKVSLIFVLCVYLFPFAIPLWIPLDLIANWSKILE